jgi:hypothetical protein
MPHFWLWRWLGAAMFVAWLRHLGGWSSMLMIASCIQELMDFLLLRSVHLWCVAYVLGLAATDIHM